MKTTTKRFFSVFLTAMLLFGVFVPLGMINAQAANPTAYFGAPETIYSNPLTTGAQAGTQFFANNWTAGRSGPGWQDPATVGNTGTNADGYIHFYCAGATDIKLFVDDAPNGFGLSGELPATTAPAAGDCNYTIPAGIAAPNAGQVRWKATYKVNNTPYTAYGYSYVFRNDPSNVSGSAATSFDDVANTIGGDTGYRRNTTGLFIIGGHSVEALAANTGTNGRWRDTSTGDGNSHLWYKDVRNPTATFLSDVWNGYTSTGGATATADSPDVLPGAGYNQRTLHGTTSRADTGNNLDDRSWLAAARVGGTGSIACEVSLTGGGTTGAMVVGTSNANGNTYAGGGAVHNNKYKGVSYLQIDSSRYQDLNQIPQLRAVYMLTQSWNQSFVADGWYGSRPATYQNEYGNWGGATEGITPGKLPDGGGYFRMYYAKLGEFFREPLQRPLTQASPCPVYADYEFRFSGTYIPAVMSVTSTNEDRHRLGTSVSYTLRDKTNLRTKLQEETNLALQAEGYTPASWNAYRTALENLSLALCNPAYDFADADLDLAAVTVTGSLANKVKIAYEGLKANRYNLNFYNSRIAASPLISLFTWHDQIFPLENVLDIQPFARTGCELTGWRENTSGVVYKLGDRITLNRDADFYAVWVFSKDVNNDYLDTTENVTVYPADAFAEGTRMNVVEGNRVMVFPPGGGLVVLYYDISFTGYGPNGPNYYPLPEAVTVRFSLPDDFTGTGTFTIKHLQLDGTLKTINSTPITIDGKRYIEFKTNHFSLYALVFQPGAPDWNGNSQTFTYKKGNTFTLQPPAGVTVQEWKTSNAKTATVANGKITLRIRGEATITAVIDADTAWTYKVTVKFNFWQWLLYIFLFGWIWM